MTHVFKLSDVERQTLQELSASHRHRDIRVRASGLLMLDRGMTAPRAAARLNVSAQSLYNWSRRWQQQGLGALLGGHAGGRPRLLSEAMLATAIEVAGSGSRTLSQIARCVETRHGEPLPCRLDTLGAALRREGLSIRRNSSRHAGAAGLSGNAPRTVAAM